MGNYISSSSTSNLNAATNATSTNNSETPFMQELRHYSLPPNALPIFYDSRYNMGFGGIEKYLSPHPFDVAKYGKIANYLISNNVLSSSQLVSVPQVATDTDLLVAHSASYLETLSKSIAVARIAEVAVLAFLPIALVRRAVLTPQRVMTSGTCFAAKTALASKWSINLGGGFHHASSQCGGGFCVYADISMAIKILLKEKQIQKAMIIDLDAHQGNGHELDFKDNKDSVYIFDIYNKQIYPNDIEAKQGISLGIPVTINIEDEEYLQKLKDGLDKAFTEFKPDLIVYNAGTDCLEWDPLGRMALSEKGIIARDEMVFEKAKSLNIPITMVLSGGYQENNADIISRSIINLFNKLDLKTNL